MADFQADAFGLVWRSDIPLNFLYPSENPCVDADVRVARVSALRPRASGIQINRGWVYENGIRFAWEDDVAFDMRDGDSIDYARGPAWSGDFPDAFYGSVIALSLAWRGLLPFHASTVVIDGRSVLIAGASGSGKSTLAAALTRLGVRWIADDLSAVSCDEAGRFRAYPGRAVVRLHAQVCDWIGARERRPAVADAPGKRLATLDEAAGPESHELACIVVLGLPPGLVGGLRRLRLLTQHQFRPRWLSLLPNAPLRRCQLLTLAEKVPMIGIPAAEIRDVASFHAHAKTALELIRPILP